MHICSYEERERERERERENLDVYALIGVLIYAVYTCIKRETERE